MPRGRRRADSGRKKGSKNKRLRRMLAIDAFTFRNWLRSIPRLDSTRSTRLHAQAGELPLQRLRSIGSSGKSTVQVDVSARDRVHVASRSEVELRQGLIDHGHPERLFSDNAAP